MEEDIQTIHQLSCFVGHPVVILIDFTVKYLWVKHFYKLEKVLNIIIQYVEEDIQTIHQLSCFVEHPVE